MAQLKDLLVNGVSRLIGDVFIQKINAPTATGGTTFGSGTSGQVLKTNGSTIYWGEDSVNAGTVTSVQVAATSPVVSSTGTASSSSLSTTISLADGYGDTKNPYASKTKNYVLASPNGSNGAPSFRALVTSDLPISSIAASSILMTASTATNNLVVRSVTNASTNTAIAGSTNIPTMNTIYYGLVQVNGASQTRATTIYAPTSVGNASQLLISGGSGNAPSWLTAGTAGQILKTTSSGIAWSDSIVDSLTTVRSIDGVNFDGSADVVHYGICYTPQGTAKKVVNTKTTSSADPADQTWVDKFTLKKGSIFYIKFTNSNTATGNITLNINSTGEKAIYDQHGQRIGVGSAYADYLQANKIYKFLYDGTNYIIMNQPKALELYQKRQDTTNLNNVATFGGLGSMFHLVHTSSTNTTEANGKLPEASANVLQMNWDNSTSVYNSQLAIAIGDKHRAWFRGNTISTTHGTWQEIAHAPVSTDSTGSDTRPVYMASNGTITPIDGPIATTYGGTGATDHVDPHYVFVGPNSNTAGAPSFRNLNLNDIPNGVGIAYCDTASNAGNKQAILKYFTSSINKIEFYLFLKNDNTAEQTITLCVTDGSEAQPLAFPIAINGTITSSSNYTLPAGLYKVIFTTMDQSPIYNILLETADQKLFNGNNEGFLYRQMKNGAYIYDYKKTRDNILFYTISFGLYSPNSWISTSINLSDFDDINNATALPFLKYSLQTVTAISCNDGSFGAMPFIHQCYDIKEDDGSLSPNQFLCILTPSTTIKTIYCGTIFFKIENNYLYFKIDNLLNPLNSTNSLLNMNGYYLTTFFTKIRFIISPAYTRDTYFS